MSTFKTIKTVLFVPSITVFVSRYGTQWRFIGIIVNTSILSRTEIKIKEKGGERNDPKLVNDRVPDSMIADAITSQSYNIVTRKIHG